MLDLDLDFDAAADATSISSIARSVASSERSVAAMGSPDPKDETAAGATVEDVEPGASSNFGGALLFSDVATGLRSGRAKTLTIGPRPRVDAGRSAIRRAEF